MYTVTNLQKELEKAKDNLREVEESLHKVDGKTTGNGAARFVKQEGRNVRNWSFGDGDNSKRREFPQDGFRKRSFPNVTRESPGRSFTSRKRDFTANDDYDEADDFDDTSPSRKKAFSSVVSQVSLPDLSLNLKSRRDRRDRHGDAAKMKTNDSQPRPKSVFSRLSGPRKVEELDDDDEEDEPILKRQPVLTSRVIPIDHPTPSREQAMASQNKNEAMKQRDRRMFGALVGTLQQFRKEETQVKKREERRQEIERKLEEEAKKEKEQAQEEKKQLWIERYRREAEIKRIEWSLNRVKEYEAWEASVLPLRGFIRTKAEPHIFYLPKIMTPQTEEKVQETVKVIQEMIDKRLASLNEEIEKSEKKARGVADGAHGGGDDEDYGDLDGGDKENLDISHDQHRDADESMDVKENVDEDIVWDQPVLERSEFVDEAQNDAVEEHVQSESPEPADVPTSTNGAAIDIISEAVMTSDNPIDHVDKIESETPKSDGTDAINSVNVTKQEDEKECSDPVSLSTKSKTPEKSLTPEQDKDSSKTRSPSSSNVKQSRVSRSKSADSHPDKDKLETQSAEEKPKPHSRKRSVSPSPPKSPGKIVKAGTDKKSKSRSDSPGQTKRVRSKSPSKTKDPNTSSDKNVRKPRSESSTRAKRSRSASRRKAKVSRSRSRSRSKPRAKGSHRRSSRSRSTSRRADKKPRRSRSRSNSRRGDKKPRRSRSRSSSRRPIRSRRDRSRSSSRKKRNPIKRGPVRPIGTRRRSRTRSPRRRRSPVRKSPKRPAPNSKRKANSRSSSSSISSLFASSSSSSSDSD